MRQFLYSHLPHKTPMHMSCSDWRLFSQAFESLGFGTLARSNQETQLHLAGEGARRAPLRNSVCRVMTYITYVELTRACVRMSLPREAAEKDNDFAASSQLPGPTLQHSGRTDARSQIPETLKP